MEKKKLYIPSEDDYYSQPYIDEEEWRDTPVRHYYVHGGFRGTEKNGIEARFCFYFPEKEKYEERFFQYVSPAPGDEHENEWLRGEDDKISFCLTHSAYLVNSNQGGFIPEDGERLYKTSAQCAEFSRKVARKLYCYEHRPYGYIFGGSGGSFKTIGCMEMTEGIWDGGVPYVTANPMAVPNVFGPRVRVMRMLGEEKLKHLVDTMEPGGSGNIYEGLDEEQRLALEEATKMGFPKRGWFLWPTMEDGALMVLAPYIYNVFPDYFTDFWEKPGYAGADPNSNEAKARIQFETKVAELIGFRNDENNENYSSVDKSWQNMSAGQDITPQIRMEDIPEQGKNLFHCRIKVLSGKAKGKENSIEKIENDVITVGKAFDWSDSYHALTGLAVGDKIMLDNSDYLAMQTFQRHQVPDDSYHVYDQYRDKKGNPIYPQLPFLLSPIIAKNGGGEVPSGDIHGKVIAVCSLLDESAYPWHGDWYRHAVEQHLGEKTDEMFRLYYNDNCVHEDNTERLNDPKQSDPQHQVDYLGVLHQVLLDLADWCEKNKAPVPSTNYRYCDGQIEVPDRADERGGLQPVVKCFANGQKYIHVKAGETVTFTASIEVPNHTGTVTAAAWDFEYTNDFSRREKLEMKEKGHLANVKTTHIFEKPGTYFPVLKAQSSRTGTLDDIYVQCKNMDRVRVVVE